MTQQESSARLIPHETAFDCSRGTAACAIVLLRVSMGALLFQSGLMKVLDPSWTAAGFLRFAVPEGNPYITLWRALAGNPVIDILVAWGLALTGLGLIVGALTRWNAFWGAWMMLAFWAAGLHGGLSDGFPLEHGWVTDERLVYAIALFALAALGAQV